MDKAIQLPPRYAEVPYLRELAAQGVECDQFLAEAIRTASSVEEWSEDHVVAELGVLARARMKGLSVNEAHSILYSVVDEVGRGHLKSSVMTVYKRAPELIGAQWTAASFVAQIREGVEEHDEFILKDLIPRLGKNFGVPKGPPKMEKVGLALGSLAKQLAEPGDVELILALDASNRFRVRATGRMGDFVQRSPGGLLVPSRAVLVHHQTFGSFSKEQIEELEDLINAGRTSEEDLQKFFERYPHFFRTWDHRAVHPHVYLTREADGDGPLIPDFILTHREAQKAFLVDLKLPGEKLITRQRNRERFSGAITEAKAQLSAYRDWFEDRYNCEKLKDVVGMSIYRPQLSVVIGRSSEFRDEIDRQRLAASEPGLQVVTYDDILADAKARQLLPY